MGNPVPTQTHNVDAYSSFSSNNVNALTRIVSGRKNCILSLSPIDAYIFDSTAIIVTEGICIKDDVLIEISQISIDMTDSDFYVNSSGGVWNEDGYYYIVLEYTYVKSKPPPTAAIKIIKPSQRTNPAVYNTGHLLLKVIDTTSNILIKVLDYDPSIPENRRIYAGTTQIVVQLIASDYDIQLTDNTCIVTGNTTLTLPPASFKSQHRIIKKDGGSTIVTVIPRGGETIEGQSQILLLEQYDAVTLISDGVDLWVEV